jgi:elongation factor 4
MRKAREAVLGDTLHQKDHPVTPLLDIQPAKPMVFAGVYPFNASEHRDLKLALEKLCLNDSSVTVMVETSPALGQGWRLGFLGVLHMEVFTQRLDQEQDAQVVITAPSVPYRMLLNDNNSLELRGKEITASNPSEFLDKREVTLYSEPVVAATIIAPLAYLAGILELCHEMRGVQRNIENIDQTRLNIQFYLPLNEIVTNFFDKLKSITSGYASFDYEDAGYEPSDLVRLDVLLNGTAVPELASICHTSKALGRAKSVVANLKDELPRQQFSIAIQAAVRGKVLARSDIKPVRKDVTAKCYGGDMSRKMKLLKYQAEGKKRMKMVGNIEIAKETFIKILTK